MMYKFEKICSFLLFGLIIGALWSVSSLLIGIIAAICSVLSLYLYSFLENRYAQLGENRMLLSMLMLFYISMATLMFIGIYSNPFAFSTLMPLTTTCTMYMIITAFRVDFDKYITK